MKKLSALLAILLFVTTSCSSYSFGKKYWYGSTRRSNNDVHLLTEVFVSKKEKKFMEDPEEALNALADDDFSFIVNNMDYGRVEKNYSYVAFRNTVYWIWLEWLPECGEGKIRVYEPVTSGGGWDKIYESEWICNFNSARREYERQRDYYVKMLENE